jgi:hypothetical protein
MPDTHYTDAEFQARIEELGNSGFEIDLNRWGHPVGEVPPKPLSPRAIAKLGAAYERAEQARNQMADMVEFCGPLTSDIPPEEAAAIEAEEEAIRQRHREAQARYTDAVYARVRYLKWKMENSTRRVKSSDEFKLWCTKSATEQRIDLMNDMFPDFASGREWTDANAAFMLADHAYDVAKTKFEDAARENSQDRRAQQARRPAPMNIRKPKPVELS